MQSNRTLELGTGLFVLLGFVALFFLATQLPSSGLKLEHRQARLSRHRQISTISGISRSAHPLPWQA